MPMSRLATAAIAGVLAALGLAVAPSPAPAAPVAPYVIEVDGGGPNRLVLRPAPGFSTLAVQLIPGPGATFEARPPAQSFPGLCSTDLSKTICPLSLSANQLRLDAGPAGTVNATVINVPTSRVRLDGGPDSDVLNLNPNIAHAVELAPRGGNDEITITGSAGPTTLDAGDTGDDRYRLTADGMSGTLALDDGDDTFFRTFSGISVAGGPGADTLTNGGAIVGGDGPDVLQPTLTGQAGIVGGPGSDLLSYAQLGVARTLTIDTAAQSVIGDGADKLQVERLEGSPFDDNLIGSSGPDVIRGGDGNDTIQGLGGGDTLDGGAGSNTVSYAASPSAVTVNLPAGAAATAGGTDTLANFRGVIGTAGFDTLIGSAESETLIGGEGNDTIEAGLGNDSVDGGAGNDTLRPHRGSDTVQGGSGADTVLYDERTASEPVTVNLASPGGNGAAGENDTLTGVENAIGGASNDTLTGEGGPNVLDGGPGLNTIDGGAGSDILTGGVNRDVIVGGPGSDIIRAGDDDDSVNAQDNEPDNVSCGPSGDDDAQTDASDMVAECEYARRGDVPIPVDADGDGFIAGTGSGADCNDKSKAVNPTAVDVPGNKVDEDCDGFDAAVPYVDIGLTQKYSAASKTGSRRVSSLVVSGLDRAGSIRITCRAPKRLRSRCAFGSRTKKPARTGSQVNLQSLFKRRQLPPGTRIELRVTAPKFNGRVIRIDFQRGAVRRTSLCITAPSKAAKRCPEGEELG